MPLRSILPHQLSVYHPLAPCHQRRQGELVKTWSPNLRVLCTFTILHIPISWPYLKLKPAIPNHSVQHLTPIRWGPFWLDGVLMALANLAVNIPLPGILFPFFHHRCITPLRPTLGYTYQGLCARGRPTQLMRPLTNPSRTISVQRTQRMLLDVWSMALAPEARL